MSRCGSPACGICGQRAALPTTPQAQPPQKRSIDALRMPVNLTRQQQSRAGGAPARIAARPGADHVAPTIATLRLFGLASIVALRYPWAGLGICICCLIVYLKPNPPAAGDQRSLE